MIIVYKAVFEDGKFYIGITNNLSKRKNCHKRRAKNGSNLHFHNAIRKYGFSTIKWEILSYHELREEAEKEEIRLIKELKPDYNIAPGGSSPEVTDSTKKKLSKSHMGKRFSEESKKNMSIAQLELAEKRRKERGNTKSKNSTHKLKEYIINFNNGTLSKKQITTLNILKKSYINGMGIKELSKITGISYSTIVRYQWTWLLEYKHVEYRQIKPYIKHSDKDRRWKQKNDGRKKSREKNLKIMNCNPDGKTYKQIASETGLTYKEVETCKRTWENMIEEEGF